MKSTADLKKYMWAELAVWLLILFVTAAGIKFYKYQKHKELTTYQIFMPDVDGVIKGSPVRYIGVQIGYVEKVKILTDTVYLKLVITDKNIVLPKGVIATVEFNGMGGSKSLEMYPPTQESKASRNIIAVQQPKRLSAALGLLNDMFDKIDSIMVKISYFSKETGVTDKANSIELTGIQKNVNMLDDCLKNFDKGEKNGQRESN